MSASFSTLENSLGLTASLSAFPLIGATIERVSVVVNLRDRKSSAPSLGTLQRAAAAFIEHLDPWGAPCMGSRQINFLDGTGAPVGTSILTPGVTAILGNAAGGAHIFMRLLEGPELTLRLQLELDARACLENGIASRVALNHVNGREIFGRYLHLSGEGIRAGDFNARIKREVARALQRAVADAPTP